MLSVLTFNHKMHIGFFLPKVTRNRARGLHWKQREKVTEHIFPNACVSPVSSGNSSERSQWIRQEKVMLSSTQLSRRGLQPSTHSELSSRLECRLKSTASLGLLFSSIFLAVVPSVPTMPWKI